MVNNKTRHVLMLMASFYPLQAVAQDAIVVPVVPPGITPVLSWVLTIAGSVITLFIPIVAVWLRTYLGVQNAKAEVQSTQARSQMIGASMTRAAYLADLDLTNQGISLTDDPATISAAIRRAKSYVDVSHPDQIAIVPQATDEHITDGITAELHAIQLAKKTDVVPSVVLSPVSAVR